MPTSKELYDAAMNALADSINAKAGTTGKKTIAEMKTAVDGITIGVDTSDATATADKILTGYSAYGSAGTKLDGSYTPLDTSDATATASDMLDGATAYVNGSMVTGNIPSKTSSDVTASANVVSIPAGHYASAVSKTVGTAQAAQTITPTTSDQTIAAGKYLTGAQTIKGDANLVAANIAQGVTIFGVVGSHQGGGGTKPSYLISDGNTVSILYFNKDYNLDTFLSDLSGDHAYNRTDETYHFNYAYLALDYLIAIDLSTIQGAGLTGYVIFWGDPNDPAVIYSTTTFDLSSVISGMVVTTAGWQIGYFEPDSAATMDVSTSNARFVNIMDFVVAQDDIAFGDHGGSQPQLNAPSVSVNKNTLTITNPSTNGNFVSGYKVLADGTEAGTTSTTTFDLSAVTGNSAAITAKATGTNFQDSAESSSASWTRYLQVSFYDGASQMTGSPVSVVYGSTVAQAVSAAGISTIKAGYEFNGWYSDSGLTTNVPTSTAVTSNMTLYGKWTESLYMSISETITKSGIISVVGYSPDSKLYAYITSNYIYVYDATTSPYTLVASRNFTYYNTIVSARWISNNQILQYYMNSSSSSNCNILTISGSSISSAAANSSIIKNAYGRQIASNVNSSGKIVLFGNAGDKTMQIYDLTNNTVSDYDRSSASSYTRVPDMFAYITDDDVIIGNVNSGYRYFNSTSYTSDGSNIMSVSAGQAQRNANFANNKLIFALNDTSVINKGNAIYIYSYSSGSFSQTKKIQLDTSTENNYSVAALINPADDNYIYTYNNKIYVYNMNGALIQELSLTNAIRNITSNAKYGVTACISNDGKKMSIQYDANNIYIFEIKPMT